MNMFIKYQRHSRPIYNACVCVLGDMIKLRVIVGALRDKQIIYYYG